MKLTKWGSRKLISAWILTLLSTLLFAVPISVSALSWIVIGMPVSWYLLGSAEWVTLISVIWGGYFAANVAGKHRAFYQEEYYNVSNGEQDIDKEINEDAAPGPSGLW